MRKSKVHFIADLLAKKRLQVGDKEKLFHLASKELKNLDTTDESLLKRIEDLEERINGEEGLKKKNSNQWKSYHSPKNTVRFLFRFTNDDTFKYFTHKQENDFNYEELINKALQEFKSLNSETLNPLTWKKVNNFCFQPDKNFPLEWENYYGIKIKYGWHSIKEWCKENPGIYPTSMPLPKEPPEIRNPAPNIQLHTFGDVITQFKHTIEIRQDDRGKTLDQHIKAQARATKISLDFDIEYLGNFNQVNVYTDVHLLNKAIGDIFSLMNNYRSKSNKIKIEIINSSETYWELRITHVNSFIDRSENDDKLRKASGTLGEIRKMLFCICDWEILTNLNDKKPYKLELLNQNVKDENEEVVFQDPEEGVDGVTHILRLYKTTDL